MADKLLLNVSVMVHKCLNGPAPDYPSQKFTRRQAHHDRNTKIPESTEMQIKNWACSDLLPLEGLLFRHEGSSR